MAVTDEAIEKLKQMILSGELRPGDRLPREADLAHMLELSRSSLREAVRALSWVRILDVRQGDGTYVSSLAADTLLDALSFIVEFHRDRSVLEVLELRRILEPASCAQAALRIGPEALTQLKVVLGKANAQSPVDELVAVDMEFHRLIGVASGNSLLASLVESLSGPSQRARIWRGVTEEGALNRTLTEHRRIYDALAARDAELARSVSTVHVAGVESWIRSTLVQPANA